MVRRVGWLSRVKGEQVRECTVWDESDTGMRLVVKIPDEIPDTFYVYSTLDFYVAAPLPRGLALGYADRRGVPAIKPVSPRVRAKRAPRNDNTGFAKIP